MDISRYSSRQLKRLRMPQKDTGQHPKFKKERKRAPVDHVAPRDALHCYGKPFAGYNRVLKAKVKKAPMRRVSFGPLTTAFERAKKILALPIPPAN